MASSHSHVSKNIELWPIEKLKPYKKNARTHSDEQVHQLMSSMKEFGFTAPILVDSEHGILAGHGRLEAAKRLFLNDVPVIVLDHLTEKQRRAYIIADNKLALNAGWNFELLAEEMLALDNDGFDLRITGFSLAEIDELLVEPDFKPGNSDEQGKLDEKKKVKCPECLCEFVP